MTLPTDLGGWLWLIIRLLFLLVSPTWFAWRVSSTVLAHSICLSGQRSRHKSALWYRFAIQNNEDVSLSGQRVLTIRILEDDGRFLSSHDEAPRLFVGCNPVRAFVAPDLRVLKLEFEELPAYDTWSIECHTNDLARNLVMTVEESKPATDQAKEQQPAPSRPAVLSHTRLSLYGDQRSVFEGARTTPEATFAATAIGLLFLGYFAIVGFLRSFEYSWVDVACGLLILAFGFAMWWVIRRPAPSISQGYWAATVVDRISDGRSDAARVASA